MPFIAVALLAPTWFLVVNPKSDLLAQWSASLPVVALAVLIHGNLAIPQPSNSPLITWNCCV
jgi:hypothetical protein